MDTVISGNSISKLLQHSHSSWVAHARPKIDRIAIASPLRKQA